METAGPVSFDAAESASRTFQGDIHREQRQLRMYGLHVAKNGPKIEEFPPDDSGDGIKPPPPMSAPPRGYQGPVNVVLGKVPMARVVNVLSG
jgi:uncharacterized protein (TIGR03435 family)